MGPFLTYTRFYTVEDASALIETIKVEGMPFILDLEVNQLDKVYLGESLDPMVSLKIPQDQFTKLNLLLMNRAEAMTEEADSTYYLYSFSNEELASILDNPNDWNAYDRGLAKKMLMKRNIAIPEFEISAMAAYQPENLATSWVILGYILSTLFAMQGIFIGLSILGGKKTLYNGEIVTIYDNKSLRHGDLMTIIGTISTIYFLLRVFRQSLDQVQISPIDFLAFVLP